MANDQIIIEIDNYGHTNAPDAAKFGIGAVNIEQIEQATQARRDLISQQSDATTGPVRRD